MNIGMKSSLKGSELELTRHAEHHICRKMKAIKKFKSFKIKCKKDWKMYTFFNFWDDESHPRFLLESSLKLPVVLFYQVKSFIIQIIRCQQSLRIINQVLIEASRGTFRGRLHVYMRVCKGKVIKLHSILKSP